MRENKTKTFTYWRARFSTEPFSLTMQELLESAFDNTKVQDRLWPPQDAADEDASYFNFINHKTIYKGYFCANFFGYERGKIGQVIKEAFNDDEIDPTALPAPKAADGTDQQFLDGKLYFICFGNHLILAQDPHLKARHLEPYLNEMFHRRCQNFPEKQSVLLERSISQKTRGQIQGVKRINLSAPLSNTGDEIQTADVQLATESRIFHLGGRAWEAIKAFVGGDLSQFETGGFIDLRDIDVTLSLAWKRRRGERFSDQVDSLANAFRHVEDEMDVEYETNSGKVKHDELRLSYPKSVFHRDDMPDTSDIFDKMIEWYESLVEAEDIS